MGLILNDNDVRVCLGGDEVSAIYMGEAQVYPNTPFMGVEMRPSRLNFAPNKLTQNIKIRAIDTWTINVPSGSPFTFSQMSGGDSSVPETTTELTVTFDDSEVSEMTDYTFTIMGVINLICGVRFTPCQPIMCADHLSNTNNVGDTMSGNYLIDTHVTEITDCNYNVNGLKSFCIRTDGGSTYFYNKPAICLRKEFTSNVADYCNDLRLIDLSIPTFDRLTMITSDNGAEEYPNLKTIKLRNTENVTMVTNAFYGLKYLETLELGDMSNVTTRHSPSDWNKWFYGNTNLVNFSVEKLPNNDEMSTWNIAACTKLSTQSLMNIANALPQRVSILGNKKCVVGTVNYIKLTQEMKDIANSKGWTFTHS